MVPEEGIEPTRCYHHEILSLARLPIPPLRHNDWSQQHAIFLTKTQHDFLQT